MSYDAWPLIQINSTYLTDNLGSGGTKYIAQVDGIDALALTGSVQIIKALSGKPYMQASETQLGKPIVIRLDNILEAAHDAIVAHIQAYITSGTAITLSISGGPYPNITSLSVIPDENPVRYSGFENLRLRSVSYAFLTV